MSFRRLAALGGILDPVLFAGVVTSLSILQYDFMRGLGWDPLHAPTFDWPSGLSLGPYGIWMTLTFIVSGLLMATFALALRTALDKGTAPRIGTLGLLLSGCALMGLAFTTDPTIRTTPACTTCPLCCSGCLCCPPCWDSDEPSRMTRVGEDSVHTHS
jgi:hypothetical protein